MGKSGKSLIDSMVNLFSPCKIFCMIIGVLIELVLELAKLYIFNAVALELNRVRRVDIVL